MSNSNLNDATLPKKWTPTKWVIESLSRIARHQDPLSQLRVMLDAVQNPTRGKTVLHHFCAPFMLRELISSQLAATDVTRERLVAIFNLNFDVAQMNIKPWKLQCEQYEMPQRLKDILYDVTRALCDDASEATSRIAVDMMLIACKLHLMDLYPAHFSPKKRKVASRPGTPPSSELREMVRIYPELELAVDIMDPHRNEKVRITGRADWGFGYSGRHGAAHGTFLVAIEAKRRNNFNHAEEQLLTYLAILRELRIRAGKTNTVTQGFYTDGYKYCFMAIDADGKVESSLTYHAMYPEGGKTIFNFIVTILESAMKPSPTVTPTKDAEQRDKEVNDFTGEIWSQVYEPYLESPQIESAGENEEFGDLPPLILEAQRT